MMPGMESGGGVNVEVRATGLRGMREKKGLTQRELARNLGISQNYIPALESGARRPGPKLRQALMKFFNVNFEELFEVVMVNPESSKEQVLEAREERRAG
ncbi:MAG: helix-turn-helix transcriptional regulator [Candidatus Dormibacter sp.]